MVVSSLHYVRICAPPLYPAGRVSIFPGSAGGPIGRAVCMTLGGTRTSPWCLEPVAEKRREASRVGRGKHRRLLLVKLDVEVIVLYGRAIPKQSWRALLRSHTINGLRWGSVRCVEHPMARTARIGFRSPFLNSVEHI